MSGQCVVPVRVYEGLSTLGDAQLSLEAGIVGELAANMAQSTWQQQQVWIG